MTYCNKQRTQSAWAILPFLAAPLIPLVSEKDLGGPADEQFIAPQNDENSQTMDLLSPASGPMMAFGKGGPSDVDLVIIEDSALQGSTGPVGTIMNLSDVPRNGRNITKYVARPGDTVSIVAQMFGVSTNTIRWQNKDIDDEILKAGDIIEILPVDGISYTVKSGDTVAEIASRYKVSTDKVTDINNIVPGAALPAGTKLILPGAKPLSDTGSKTTTSSTSTTKRGAGSTTSSARGGRVMTKEEMGSYVWPLAGGIVTQGYGSTSFATRSGYYKNDFHGGVDIGTPTGTRVFATKSGVVTEAKVGYNGGYGNYITLRHDDGTMSRYGHLSKLLVKTGERVDQGSNIALSGNTGRSTGPHLHFEVRDSNGKQLESNPFYKKYRNY